MASLKFFFITFAACVAVAVAYSTGAPADACADLTPQHGPVKSQSSPVPYSVILEGGKAARGQAIKVTIRGNSPDDKIQGFLIQARDGKLPIGQFKVVDKTKSQLLSCDGGNGNSITHKKITGDVTEVTFQWIAPSDFSGQVNFVGTVALNGGVFWNNVRSAAVTVA